MGSTTSTLSMSDYLVVFGLISLERGRISERVGSSNDYGVIVELGGV